MVATTSTAGKHFQMLHKNDKMCANLILAIRKGDSGGVDKALDAAHAYLADTLERLVARGKLARDAADATLARVRRADALADLAGCRVVVEAIVERLAPKQELFRALEAILAPDAILATNTSSLSVTEIGESILRPWNQPSCGTPRSEM